MSTTHTDLPRCRYAYLIHLLQLAHGPGDFDLSLHSAMVTSPKPMVHRDWHIANGIPASRELQWTINLDLASQARSYAPIRQPLDSTHNQLRRKKQNTGHGAEATAQPPSNQHAAKPSLPVLYLVMLAYTKSRFVRQALVPQYVSDVARTQTTAWS
jgi:hypothetical protein